MYDQIVYEQVVYFFPTVCRYNVKHTEKFVRAQLADYTHEYGGEGINEIGGNFPWHKGQIINKLS